MRTSGLSQHNQRRRVSSIVTSSSAPGPPITPTLAWYDPSDAGTVTSAAGLVSALADKSGAGHDLTAAGTGRPAIGTHTINGLDCLTFVAPNLMVPIAYAQAQPVTILAVVKANTLGTNNQPINGGSGTQPAIGMITANKWFFYAGTVQAGAVTADLNPHVLDAQFNGATPSLNLDGASLTTANPGAGSYTSGIQLSVVAQPWLGDIGEVLAYNTALTAPQRASLQAYLKAKWGTP